MGDSRKKVKESSREVYLKKHYGITEAEYGRLLKAGKGVCWICKAKPKVSLNVDHDHHLEKKVGVRNSVRGLLCFMCNKKLIGRRRREHAEMYQAAYVYLTSDKAQTLLKGNDETQGDEAAGY